MVLLMNTEIEEVKVICLRPQKLTSDGSGIEPGQCDSICCTVKREFHYFLGENEHLLFLEQHRYELCEPLCISTPKSTTNHQGCYSKLFT